MIFAVMLLTIRDLISAIPGLTGALKIIEGLNEGAKAAMTPLGSPARQKYDDIGRVNKQKMNETLGFSPGQALRAWGYNDLADQIYGPEGADEERTRKAAEEAAKRLKGGASGKTIPGFTSDEAKIRAVAAMIEAEAGGEGRLGMEAVGAVMGNRATSNYGGFGADPYSQVYARGGQEFQGMPRQPSATAMDVARRLYAGQLNDPTGGATSYANPGASTAAWARRTQRRKFAHNWSSCVHQ